MATKKIDYHQLIQHTDHFAALGIAPAIAATIKHREIESVANQLWGALRTEIRKSREQLFLVEILEQRQAAVDTAAKFFEDLQRFEGYRTAYTMHNISHQRKIPSRPPPIAVEKEDYFRDLGYSDDQIPKLSVEVILEEERKFLLFTGLRDEFGYIQAQVFAPDIHQWRKTAKALTVLKDPAQLALHKKNWQEARKVEGSNGAALKSQLQALINLQHSTIKDGAVRHKTPILAEILAKEGLTIAGQDLTGLSLRRVNCSGVDFSGSNLSNVDLREAKIAESIFSPDTIINGSTRLENVKGADKALGLAECLKANFNKHPHLKSKNPGAFVLEKSLRPRTPKSNTPQNHTPRIPAADRETHIAIERARIKAARSISTSAAKQADAKPSYRKRQKPEELRIRGKDLGPDLQVYQSAITSGPAATDQEDAFSRELDERMRLAQKKREEDLKRADALAAASIGGSPISGGSGIDDLLAELDKRDAGNKSKAPPVGIENSPAAASPEEDRKFGAKLEDAARAVREITDRLITEKPGSRHLIERVLRPSISTAASSPSRRRSREFV